MLIPGVDMCRARSVVFGVVAAGWVALGLGAPGSAGAQQPSVSQGPPAIVTTATGEATVIPDRGRITFAVEQRAATAAAAGSANARIQAAVIAALRAKGVQSQHITTTGYSVMPDEQYPKGERKVVGYVARNGVNVDVQRIDQVGSLIDAALTAGANSIGGLNYYSTAFDSVRQRALEQAVTKARADAEVVARAAGGSLGTLVEVTVHSNGPRAMNQFVVTGAARVLSAEAATPVEVGEQSVAVTVTVRWSYLARP
jgi:uncharacterized protein YggE